MNRIILLSFFGIVCCIALADIGTRQLFADDRSPGAAAISPESVAATLNGHDISVADIDRVMKQKPAYAPFLANSAKDPDALANMRLKVLQSMIDRELLLDAAKKSTVVNEDDIKKTAESVIARYGGEEKLTAMLKPSGLSLQQFQDDLKNDLKISQYLDKTLMKNATVSDEELKKVFDQAPQKYSERQSVRARHILIKLARNATPEQEKAAKDKIDKLYTEVTKPSADFAAIAKASSECPSAPQGGDLGYFSKGTMVPEFEHVAFALKPGEIAPPVRTDFGFHIIKLEDKKEGSKPDFEKAKPLIERDLLMKKKTDLVEAHVKSLRSTASIEVKLHAS